MFYPTCDVPTAWIVVCPMDDPTFRVPNVLTGKANAIAFFESADSGGDVNVVCNKECLS